MFTLLKKMEEKIKSRINSVWNNLKTLHYIINCEKIWVDIRIKQMNIH